MEIWHEGGSYLNRLKADDEIKAALNDDELDALFNLISILPASMRLGGFLPKTDIYISKASR